MFLAQYLTLTGGVPPAMTDQQLLVLCMAIVIPVSVIGAGIMVGIRRVADAIRERQQQ